MIDHMHVNSLVFEMLGVRIGVQCHAPDLRALVVANWGHMETHGPCPDVMYSVRRDGPLPEVTLTRLGNTPITSADAGEFLYEFEKDITVELQRRRADLYFLHAAVAEMDGRAILLVAKSGGGKSTTLWALLHHGFGYMSDELAPIDIATMQVHGYQHAVCLKCPPQLPYALPLETVSTPPTLHVPVSHLPGGTMARPCRLAAMFFMTYRPDATTPAVHAISTGEASARLYASALNQLAHPNAGLDAAVRIAEAVPGFVLDSADLAATCALISSTLNVDAG